MRFDTQDEAGLKICSVLLTSFLRFIQIVSIRPYHLFALFTYFTMCFEKVKSSNRIPLSLSLWIKLLNASCSSVVLLQYPVFRVRFPNVNILTLRCDEASCPIFWSFWSGIQVVLQWRTVVRVVYIRVHRVYILWLLITSVKSLIRKRKTRNRMVPNSGPWGIPFFTGDHSDVAWWHHSDTLTFVCSGIIFKSTLCPCTPHAYNLLRSLS